MRGMGGVYKRGPVYWIRYNHAVTTTQTGRCCPRCHIYNVAVSTGEGKGHTRIRRFAVRLPEKLPRIGLETIGKRVAPGSGREDGQR